MNNKKLDSYSLLICSKYFKTNQDFLNVISVCKRFQKTTEKLRFNPIPITSLKLFPNIQTQYLYTEDDIKIQGIDKYELWYEVDYFTYLKIRKIDTTFHNIIFTQDNRDEYCEGEDSEDIYDYIPNEI
ncbi:F-box domain-containing protein [Entamoeba marina]